MAEKEFVKGPLLPKPQEVFPQIQFNWSTNISIDGPGKMTDTGYYGPMNAPPETHDNPAIVIRDGYAKIRAIFILKKNIETEEEWKAIAEEAMSRPECALGRVGTGTNGVSKQAIQKVYKNISYMSEFPFPKLKPAFCLDEMYDKITFKCEGHGPCQNDREHVSGAKGAACKPGDIISYSRCASMHCYCNMMQDMSNIVRDLERILPTRHQLMLMEKFDQEGETDEKPMDAGDLIKKKRSEAAKKAWVTRRARAAKTAEMADPEV